MPSLYSFNEKFFDSITTEGQAYALGLMFADGNVHTKRNAISLTLCDKDIVYKMKDLLEATHPVRKKEHKNPNHNDSYELCINSAHMKASLITLGCVPNKTSYNIVIPSLDNDDLVRHFIRGYFDGDGNVTIKPPRIYESNFYGCKSMMESISQVIELVGVSHILRKHGNSFRISMFYNNTRRLRDYMYNNASVYMERKYDIFMSKI